MKYARLALVGIACLWLGGCMVGPKYSRPAVPVTPAFKEQGPASFKEMDGWKTAQPSDQTIRGSWWELFEDSQLNALETQVDIANQTLQQAAANFAAARAAIRVSRSNRAPTVTAGPSVGALRDSANQPYFNKTAANGGTGNFVLPFDLNYEVDLWGRVRRTVTSAIETAQASAADMETARLSLHAELAVDYFNLRSADTQEWLLAQTAKAYQDALQLTQDRYEGGASPESDVTQARTLLLSAQAAMTDVAAQRAQYEHAIAVLMGKPPAALTLPAMPLTVHPPTLAAVPGAFAFAVAGTQARYRSRRAPHGRSQRADRNCTGRVLSHAEPLRRRGFRRHLAVELAHLAEPPLGSGPDTDADAV